MARDHEPDAVSSDTVIAPPAPPKPRFRGRLHQIAFIVSIPAGLVLVVLGNTAWLRLALAVYAGALVNMFGTSGAYHRLPWSPKALDRMKRLDHSAIYLLIAGTYTAMSTLALHGVMRLVLLSAVWAGAAVGIGFKLVQIHGFHALGGAMYGTLGWAAVIAMPQFFRELPLASFVLIIVGGLLYSGGAIVLGRRRPDPNPLVFGYHEVWHACMTSAAGCHYVAILLAVLAAR
jgi:hemolysin III